MPTIVTDMEAQASDSMVWGVVSRLERDGHHLTPSAIAKLHAIIDEYTPDLRAEGSQRELAALIRERMQRDAD